MRKILSVCLVIMMVFVVSGCKKSKKDQAKTAIELCEKYYEESANDPTDDTKASKADEACRAATELIGNYIQSDEFEEDIAKDLEKLYNDIVGNK